MTGPRRACLALISALLCAAPAAAGEGAGKSELEAERAKFAATRLKAMDAARRTFVKVRFSPKWDEECSLEAAVGTSYSYGSFWSASEGGEILNRLRNFMELHRQKRTSTVPGMVIGPGLVVVADDGTGYEWKLVEKVEVEDASGRRWKATPHKLLTAASAILFTVQGAKPPAAPAFRDDFKFSLTSRVFGTSLTSETSTPDKWYVLSGGAYLPFDAKPAAAGRLLFPVGGSSGRTPAWTSGGATLLFDSEARPVGINIGRQVLTNGNRAAWDVKAILADGAVSYDKVRKAEAAAREQSLKLFYKVRFEFRVEKNDDGDMWSRRRYYPRTGGSQDAEGFGLSVGGGRVFVPRALKPDALRTVEKVSVKVGGAWKKAKFAGAYRDFSGMLIEVPGVKLAEPKGLYATKGVEMMKPFVYCAVRELLGKTNAYAKAIRYRGRRMGYKDRVRPLVGDVPVGALLFDLEGKLSGICIRERRDRDLVSLRARRSYYYSMKNLVSFAKLRSALENPKKHALPTWRPMSKQEAKRLVWLGVEFDPITKELAKRLKVDGPTRGGAVGLIVSSVYPGSPAARLGIEARDVLLRVEVKGLGDPVPLMSSYASEMAERWSMIAQRMAGLGMQGMGARTWKPRANFLSGLLTEAGPGHDAEVVYLRHKDKKIRKGSFKLAYGPVDYGSAKKHKDEKLGLSVKPLTYEVRLALALKKDAPGVVISKVEPGSAAQLARLSAYALITHIEGQPVKSVDEFKKGIAALRKAKQEKVKFQVSIMGKSRFADLKLED